MNVLTTLMKIKYNLYDIVVYILIINIRHPFRYILSVRLSYLSVHLFIIMDQNPIGLRINRDINCEETLISPKHPLYLLNDIDCQNPIFTADRVIPFLSGIECSSISISSKIHRSKNINFNQRNYVFDRCLNVYHRFNDDDEIQDDKILKIFYDTPGNFFLIQIVKPSRFIQFENKSFQGIDGRKFHAWVFNPVPQGEPTLINNKGYNNNMIIAFLSTYFNNIINIKKVNQFTAAAFASVSPQCDKTLQRRLNHNYENANDLKTLFECFGGNLFLVKGDGFLEFEGNPIKALVWIPSVAFELLHLSNCIELDTSFFATKPNVFSVPMLIYCNTGIPLGLIVGPTESSEFYTLFYKAFEEINSDLFEELKSKCILSDQHTSFEALQKKYNFELFFCYVHIIRSFGASSAISILVREILFCKTQEEFESIYLRIIKTFKYLLEIGGSAVIHKEKFQKIFGFDENGNPVNRSTMMEPFFIRIQKGVPSSTNHIERFHRYCNESVKGLKNIYRKLGRVLNCITKQISRANENILRKLKDYISNLKKFAYEKIEQDPSRICEFANESCKNPKCVDGLFYSQLHKCELPCIHEILNSHWKNCEGLFFDEFHMKEIPFQYEQTELKLGFLDDHLNVKERAGNGESDSEDIIDTKASTHDYFDNLYANMVNRTFVQLHSVMKNKIKIQEVAGYACEQQVEMLKDENFLKMLQNDIDEFLIILSVKIIRKA